MPLRETLELDTSRALSDVGRIGASLESAAGRFGVAVTRALDPIRSGVEVPIEPDTSDVAPEVEGAVDAADSNVEVTGDANELTGDVEGAIDAADENVVVTGDAGELTGDVDAALDAADTNVEITGEAGDVTGTIDAAVQAANTTVTIDGQVGPGLAGADDALGGITQGADEATAGLAGLAGGALGAGRAVTGAIGVVAGAAVVSFGSDIIGAASDVVESTNKVGEVFQDQKGPILDFAQTSSTSIGLSEQAALEAAGTFGNLFTSLGLSTGEAANLSTEFLTLAADLASFNNIPVDDALLRLRSGLVGEIEPLRRLGISFNAAQVEAKALELGLADTNGEVSEAAKVQARAALITELSSNASGDFARTSDDLANKQRIVAAEYENTQAALGNALLPTFLTFLNLTQDLLPVVESLGTAVGPVLAAGFDLIAVALGPVVTVVSAFAAGIEAIPGPVIAAATGIGLLAVAIKVALSGALTGIGTAITGFLLTPLGAVVTAISVVITVIGFMAQARQKEEERIQATRDALFDEVDARDAATDATEAQQAAIEGLTTDLGNFILEESRFAEGNRNQIDDLARIGLTAEDVGEQLTGGAEGFRSFFDAATAGNEFEVLDKGLEQAGISLDELIAGLQEGDEQFTISGNHITTFAADGSANMIELAEGNVDLLTSFIDVRDEIEKAGEAQLDARAAAGLLTDAQREYAIESTRAEDGTASFAAAAEFAENNMDELAFATGEVTDEQAVLLGLLDQAPTQVLASAQAWDVLAIAIANGSITSADYQSVAERFNTSKDVITQFAEAAQAAITEFSDSVVSQFPAVGDAVEIVDGKFDPAQFIADLEARTAATLGFTDNVQQLLDEGLTGAAQTALDLGPEVGGQFAAGLTSANPLVRLAAERQIDEYTFAQAGLEARVRDEFAPRLVTEVGGMAQAATDEFGLTLQFDPAAQAQFDAVIAVFGAESPEAAFAAQLLGESTTTGYTTGVSGMSTAADTAVSGASGAITGAAPENAAAAQYTGFLATGGFVSGLAGMGPAGAGGAEAGAAGVAGTSGAQTAAGAEAGESATGGFAAGVEAVPGEAQAVFDEGATAIAGAGPALQSVGRSVGTSVGVVFVGSIAGAIGAGAGSVVSVARGAVSAASAAAGLASTIGFSIGQALGLGMARGISSTVATIASEAARAVNEAERAARDAADASSPSRLFADLGNDLGEGIAVGLRASERDVVDAAERLTRAAAGATAAQTESTASVATTAARVAADAAVRAGSGGDGSPNVQVIVVPFDRLGDVLPEGVRLDERAFLEGRI